MCDISYINTPESFLLSSGIKSLISLKMLFIYHILLVCQFVKSSFCAKIDFAVQAKAINLISLFDWIKVTVTVCISIRHHGWAGRHADCKYCFETEYKMWTYPSQHKINLSCSFCHQPKCIIFFIENAPTAPTAHGQLFLNNPKQTSQHTMTLRLWWYFL